MNPSLTWMLFEDDPEIGRRVWIGYDEKGHYRAAHIEQDVDQIIEANRIAADISSGTRFGDYNLVASVPVTFLESKGLDQAIDAQDRRYLSKVLNSSDYSGFRTSRGKV